MTRAHGGVLLAVLAFSAALNLWQVNFPLGYHSDELVKVGFVKTGTQDFKHPILTLQLVRIGHRVLGPVSDQQIAVLGRTVSALASTATVLVLFLLARRVFRPSGALAVAAAAAVSPTLVVHAHYLKEDTLLTLMLLASLLAFLNFAERPGRGSLLWLGLALGLAFSSHYKALLLLPLFLCAPVLGAPNGRRLYRHLGLAFLVATVVALVVNWPILADPRGFLTGANFEFEHALEGHDVRVTWKDYWLGFHLVYSLAPGMTWPALALSLAGLGWTLVRWPSEPFQHRLLAVYALLFYLVPEISPLKPAPDFARYMLPVVPILIYFWWRGLDAIPARSGRTATLFVLATCLALVVVPLYDTVRLVSAMGHDTRARAADWLREHGGQALVEQYAGARYDTGTATNIDLARARQDGVRYLVTSSFRYERYFFGNRLPGQDPEIHRLYERYVDLFKYPYLEFAPSYRTFAFSNPVIRIVDIQQTK